MPEPHVEHTEIVAGRSDLSIMGRLIGTIDGWDEVDVLTHTYYDFIPAEGVPLPSGDITVNYDAGWLQTHVSNDSDEVKDHVDLIPVLAQLPLEARHDDQEADKDIEAIEPEDQSQGDIAGEYNESPEA